MSKDGDLFRREFKEAQQRSRLSRPGPSYSGLFLVPTVTMGFTLLVVIVAAVLVEYQPVQWVQPTRIESGEAITIRAPLNGAADVDTISVDINESVSDGDVLLHLVLHGKTALTGQFDSPAEGMVTVTELPADIADGQRVAVVRSHTTATVCGRLPSKGDLIVTGQKLMSLCVDGVVSALQILVPMSEEAWVLRGKSLPARIRIGRSSKAISNAFIVSEVHDSGAGTGQFRITLLPSKEIRTELSKFEAEIQMEIGVPQKRLSIGKWIVTRMGLMGGSR